MSDNMRWRYGDTNPIMANPNTAVEIEIGDIVYQSGSETFPASSYADQGTEANNQGALHDVFFGVAMQRSPVGETDPIRVATTGVFELTCPLGSFEIGDWIGGKEQANGTQLEDQVVAKVASAALAIGRCVKRAPAAVTKVLIEIVSTVVKGGTMPPIT